ncbi:MAG: lipoyl(octanoyl) transferase LipB [Gemmatimonadetes bacterium]|nr:lipoyl(octanoyl) transferase LipB [Gemmatimonadota bacterium]
MSSHVAVVDLGRADYGETLELQRRIAHARIDRVIGGDVLLLAEHDPVITLGRSFHAENLLRTPEQLEALGVSVFEVERGGDVTYHGPGQLVGYPIYDLTEHEPDLHVYLRQIEQCLIDTLGAFGVTGSRREDLTGVWVGSRKIASIGIHVKKWVTWHGFALNVATDLASFDLIVPCGIDDVVMTTMQRELAERAPHDLWGRVSDGAVEAFCAVFGQTPLTMALDDLRETVGM